MGYNYTRIGNTTRIWLSGHEGFRSTVFRRDLNEIVDNSGRRIF